MVTRNHVAFANLVCSIRVMAQVPSSEVLDGRTVAELLRLPHSTVLEFARRGVLPAHKLGRRWLFLRDEIDAAVRAAPANPTSTPSNAPSPRRRTANSQVSQLPLPLDDTSRRPRGSRAGAF
jgi:excisionase family DNA binding protein